MNRVRNLTDEERVARINDEKNIFAPPPLDIDCDCEQNDHFHFRTLEIKCDKCGKSEYKNDYFAYSEKEALEKFHNELNENEWAVYESTEGIFYFCNDCLLKKVHESPELRRKYEEGQKNATVEDKNTHTGATQIAQNQQSDNISDLLNDI